MPTQIAGGEIYQALERGTIDAAEWVGPYDDEKLGLYKVAPNYYYPGWWEGSAMIHHFINIPKWESLPKSYQAVIRSASDTSYNWMMSRYDAANPPALQSLRSKGMQLRPFPQDVMDACYKVGQRSLCAKSAPPIPSSRRSTTPWWRSAASNIVWWSVAEYGYDSFMIRALRRQRLSARQPSMLTRRDVSPAGPGSFIVCAISVPVAILRDASLTRCSSG